ncbi:MAG TPA: alpha/beta hydrolase [Mycobacteriales bacterium]|jgi:pimeloyl-ACP methyl ester carboxylesterase|nr:alpha/beta hydrolase [Mycobacteriales bacterium]
MATVQVNGVQLGYDEAGTGPTVVLVHSALGDRRMWDGPFHDLARDHRVIRYDWRGMGESADASGDVAHHEDLLGLLDALDVEQAALAGCSMGGAYCVDVALTAPDRVTALALICAGLSGHRWPDSMLTPARKLIYAAVPAERLAAYSARTAEWVDPADVTAMAEAQLRLMMVGPDRAVEDLDPAAWRKAVELCELVFQREWTGPAVALRELDPPATGRLAEVRAPTLVIKGLADVPEIQQVSDRLATEIAGAERVELPAGHLPSIESPAAVTTALRAFLGER